jgi:hypothetical protein
MVNVGSLAKHACKQYTYPIYSHSTHCHIQSDGAGQAALRRYRFARFGLPLSPSRDTLCWPQSAMPPASASRGAIINKKHQLNLVKMSLA